MNWQIAILKILASCEGGEAPIAAITRDLALLNSIRGGQGERQRRLASRRPARDIFSDGLVDRPSAGRWRISPAGRDYLRSLTYAEQEPVRFAQAAQ